MTNNFPKKDYAIGVICYKNKYLILRFRENYKYCPTDWDFLTKHLVSKEEYNNKDKTILKTLKFHTGLNGKIKKQYSEYCWPDPEYKILWHYYPFLIEVDNFYISLNPDSKYDQYKWVSKDEILNYERLGYFRNALKNTLYKGM